MKIFRKTLCILSVVAAALCSCERSADTIPVSGEQGGDASGRTARMTFGLSAADMRTSALGAAEGRSTVDEDALKNLWVLQFDGATDASKLLFCEYYDASMIGVNDTTDDDSKKSYSLSVALYETSGDTKIYFVANVGPDRFQKFSAGDSSVDSDVTLKSFEASTLAFASEAAVSADGVLPMIGSYEGSSVIASGTVQMKRLVAKIDFTFDIQITAAGEKFTPSRVSLRSAASHTRFLEHTLPTGTTGLYPDAASSDNFINYPAVSVSGPVSKETPFTYTWYVPENLRGVVSGIESPSEKGPKNAPAGSTFIEIGGDYQRGSALTDVTYTIYLGENASTDFNVVRNYHYTVSSTIKGLNSRDLRVVVDRGVDAGQYVDGIWE
nr:DUF4906 domain-containing protein [uncultured Alistipes sp.]